MAIDSIIKPDQASVNPISELLSINDIAYSNIYFVEFLYDASSASNLNLNNRIKTATIDYFETDDNTKSVFSRIESFSIPQQLNDTHVIPYYNREFTRVSTTFKQQKILNLTFTLDDYMALLFKLSNLGKFDLSDINKTYGLTAMNNPNVCYNINLYTGFLNGNEMDINKNSVKYSFINARMLGFDNTLKFSRESAQKMNISVSFKYQEMKKTN